MHILIVNKETTVIFDNYYICIVETLRISIRNTSFMKEVKRIKILWVLTMLYLSVFNISIRFTSWSKHIFCWQRFCKNIYSNWPWKKIMWFLTFFFVKNVQKLTCFETNVFSWTPYILIFLLQNQRPCSTGHMWHCGGCRGRVWPS